MAEVADWDAAFARRLERVVDGRSAKDVSRR